MSRPRCWHCGKQLMYVKGKPVWYIYTDPIGNVHKLHKVCAQLGEYKAKPVTASFEEWEVNPYVHAHVLDSAELFD